MRFGGNRPRCSRRRDDWGQPLIPGLRLLSGIFGPMPWHVHGVMHDTHTHDGLRGRIDEVGKEVACSSPTLADVKEPTFRRKALAVMPEPRIFTQALTRLGDQSAIFRHLQRPELHTRRTEDLTNISLCCFGKDQAHDYRSASASASSMNASNSSSDSSCGP